MIRSIDEQLETSKEWILQATGGIERKYILINNKDTKYIPVREFEEDSIDQEWSRKWIRKFDSRINQGNGIEEPRVYLDDDEIIFTVRIENELVLQTYGLPEDLILKELIVSLLNRKICNL